MVPIAHIGGLPVEELALPLFAGGGALSLRLLVASLARRRSYRLHDDYPPVGRRS
jgi:hypothetical protein